MTFTCPFDQHTLVQNNGHLTCAKCNRMYPLHDCRNIRIVDMRGKSGHSCAAHLPYPQCLIQGDSYGHETYCNYDLVNGFKNLSTQCSGPVKPSLRDTKANWISQHVGKGNVILEVGIREGSMGPLLMDQNRLIGLDVCARAMLFSPTNALGQGYHVLILGNVLRIPFSAELDVVIATEIIEHIVEARRVLREINRALKSKGKLILSVPNSLSLWLRISCLLGSGKGWSSYPLLMRAGKVQNPTTSIVYPDQQIHLRFFSFSSLRQLLREEGFQVLEEYGLEANFLHRNRSLDWITQKFRTLTSNIIVIAQKG
jgi:2-polyprenyl-3-methyl-5-hydroxy-6-metoxy-1,4-benzoquinol methylase